MDPERILSDLIRINTVNPPGNETAAAIYLKKLFDSAGIPNEIIEDKKGRGSFFARIGKGDRRLLFLAHTDVVPVGDGWDFDPFAGEIRNGMVHGRGAIDCKGLLAAEACAMLRLNSEKAPLNGTLIFAATADEEIGGTFGVQYLLEHYPEMLQADFAINEGAEEPVFLNGNIIYFIQIGEKGTAWGSLEAKGMACHGSIPTLGENAVVKMVKALNALSGYKPKVKLMPEVKFLLTEISRLQDKGVPPDEEKIDLWLSSLEDKTFRETLRAMLRMTISPNVIHGGAKTNVVPDSCMVDIDIRILPGQDLDYVLRELRKYMGNEIDIKLPNFYLPTVSPSQTEYYRLIEDITGEVAGRNVICLPYISAWATDSRFLRTAGIPAYGINHMAKDFNPEIKTTIHGKNERIDVASIYLKTEFLVALAKKYLG